MWDAQQQTLSVLANEAPFWHCLQYHPLKVWQKVTHAASAGMWRLCSAIHVGHDTHFIRCPSVSCICRCHGRLLDESPCHVASRLAGCCLVSLVPPTVDDMDELQTRSSHCLGPISPSAAACCIEGTFVFAARLFLTTSTAILQQRPLFATFTLFTTSLCRKEGNSLIPGSQLS